MAPWKWLASSVGAASIEYPSLALESRYCKILLFSVYNIHAVKELERHPLRVCDLKISFSRFPFFAAHSESSIILPVGDLILDTLPDLESRRVGLLDSLSSLGDLRPGSIVGAIRRCEESHHCRRCRLDLEPRRPVLPWRDTDCRSLSCPPTLTGAGSPGVSVPVARRGYPLVERSRWWPPPHRPTGSLCFPHSIISGRGTYSVSVSIIVRPILIRSNSALHSRGSETRLSTRRTDWLGLRLKW